MTIPQTGPDNVTGIQDRPYSGWFVLGWILLGLYTAALFSIFATVATVVALEGAGQPLDVTESVFVAASGTMYTCGYLLLLLMFWMLPRFQKRVSPRRELWLAFTVFVPLWGFRRYRELVRISDKADRRMLQFSLRTLLKFVVVASLIASYGACYYEISRAGMAEAELTGIEGFFYVSMDDIAAAGDVTPRHLLLALFFCPANLVDHFVFGSPQALGHAPTMSLS